MTTTDEACKVKKRYKMWVDEAAAELQMDITALDVVHSKTDDKEYILEVNPPNQVSVVLKQGTSTSP